VLGTRFKHPPAFLGFPLESFRADKKGHVLDSLDNENQFAVIGKNRRIDRAPKPLLKSTALIFWPAHRVTLHLHYIGSALGFHALERGP